MSLPRYQRYKGCSASWLAELPSHWEMSKIRRLASLGMGQTILREMLEDGPCEGALPVYSASEGDEPFGYFKNPSVRLEKGDLIVGARGSIGMARAVTEESTCTQTTIWVKLIRDVIHPDFVYWVFVGGREGLFPFDKTAIPMLTVEQVASGSVPLPPMDEQAAIATFLDRETAKIDALIAEQEKLIALLAEKRQATISHVVTRGLNPNAPMKDSGVPWLGEVPAHWRVGKAGFYVTVLPGYAFPSTGFSQDEGDIRLLRGINVAVGELRWDEVVFWKRLEGDGLDAFELEAGDVVIGMDRPLISSGMRVATVTANDLPCLLLQRVAKIHPGPDIDGRFIMRLLGSRAFEAHFTPETTGVSVPHISGEQITNFVIPIPPIDEQSQLCQFLENELSRLASLQAEARRAVDLLRERRSALIAAAVTGQIDVRGLVPQDLAPA